MSDRIPVNGRFWRRRLSGVERYAREITGRLGERVNLLVPGKRCIRGWRGHLWEQLVLPRLVGPRDVLWSPANTGPLLVRRHVVTIHDVSPIEHPEWFSRNFARWYRFLLPRLAAGCRRLIADSAFAKSRLVDLLALPEERIVVIPLGVSAVFGPVDRNRAALVRQKYRLPAQYVMAVGPLSARKNFDATFRAWRQIRSHCGDLCLVLVGGCDRYFQPPAGRLPPGVQLTGWVDDTDLPAVYSGASVFLLTSLYEGFGLPVLEAMACGVPVVASNRGAIPEVVGDAGLLVDPSEPDAIAASVIRLLGDDDLGVDLRERGDARARDFNWDRTTELTWQVLQETAVH